MTGLKQRILGRRAASPSGEEGPPSADPLAVPADDSAAAPTTPPEGAAAPAGLSPDDAPTIAHDAVVAPAVPAEPGQPDEQTAPAGAEPVVTDRPGFRERGRMRRRLRYLRRAHELGLRDLGGLVFDLRRFRRQRFDLVEAKLQTLTLVDREMRALEHALDDRRPIAELREAGIATCSRCGALTASDANYCANCGLQIGNAPPIVSAPAPASAPAVASAPAATAAPAPAVGASEAGSMPLSTTPAPANGAAAPPPAAPESSPGVTAGDPLAPPPTSR